MDCRHRHFVTSLCPACVCSAPSTHAGVAADLPWRCAGGSVHWLSRCCSVLTVVCRFELYYGDADTPRSLQSRCRSNCFSCFVVLCCALICSNRKQFSGHVVLLYIVPIACAYWYVIIFAKFNLMWFVLMNIFDALSTGFLVPPITQNNIIINK